MTETESSKTVKCSICGELMERREYTVSGIKCKHDVLVNRIEHDLVDGDGKPIQNRIGHCHTEEAAQLWKRVHELEARVEKLTKTISFHHGGVFIT